MAYVNAAMAGPPLETPISRRSRAHHPNLWKDSFIQSLSSPYSASSYHERRETLCKEMKDMLNDLGKAEPNPTPNDLLERFWTVNAVQCLGIGRHFQNEIKLLLDYSYKYWSKEGITLDLNATALGFRILRFNGYHVSADVFNSFKDKDGQFSCPVATKATPSELNSMLSLHRASELVFPGETIMKDANIFTTKYLQHALKEWKEHKPDKTQLILEVDYALKFPWRCNAPRLEARNYIEVFRQDNTSNANNKWGFNQKLLELAILDFNILQCQHQSELKQVSRWWNESSVSQLDFFRHRHVEYYWWCSIGLFEPELGATRIGFPKLASLATLLDDIYDTYGTLDELKPFTASLVSGEISIAESLPHSMKVCLKFALELYKSINEEVEKRQGHNPNVKKYAQDCWKNYILAYFKEAEWIASNYIPTLDEYMKNASPSSALHFITIYSSLLMDTILSDKIFKEHDFLSSKFLSLIPIIGRLLDDGQDLQEEEEHGESCSTIICFKRDNPESTYEDALNYINNNIECYLEELAKEFLVSNHIPACYKNMYFNTILKGVCFMYHNRDGFTFADREIKDAITETIIQPIPL